MGDVVVLYRAWVDAIPSEHAHCVSYVSKNQYGEDGKVHSPYVPCPVVEECEEDEYD